MATTDRQSRGETMENLGHPAATDDRWPALPFDGWRETRDALHMWTQVIGKTLLARSTPQNHWWHTAFRISARGLASPTVIRDGDVTLDVEIDLVDHAVLVRSSRGNATLPLRPRSVHAFHDEYLALLRQCGVEARISTMPSEVPGAIPFDRDDRPRLYDAAAAHRFWLVLRRMDAVLCELSAGYVGKQSPVQFFWGSFDLAATRFSGRRAPERQGADSILREAYSHEVISFGFWPGGVTATGLVVDEPMLFAYAAPEPRGFRDAVVEPSAACYDERLGEFILPYEAVRTAADPARDVLAFWSCVYEAGAESGGWDRDALERAPPGSASRRGRREELPVAVDPGAPGHE